MLPIDLDLANLSLSIETDAKGFDYINDESETGVCFGIKKWGDREIVVFRGSITDQDWWRDSQTAMTTIVGLGRVHSGFAKGMLGASVKINSLLTDPSPIITGHSLGAAHASIYAAMFKNTSSLIVFGSPRVGDQEFVDHFKDRYVVLYKNRHDPVTDVPIPLPQLPYIHIRDFTLVDGLVDHSLGPILDDHHLLNYIEGMKNAQYSTSR